MLMTLFYLHHHGGQCKSSLLYLSHAAKIDTSCNENKTVCMVFQPKHRSQIVSVSFPQLTLCNFYVKYVVSFKYLGHIIFSNRKDNDDIEREVKLVLFKSYDICLYDACLWSNYNARCLTKIKLCYHKCMKMFFGFKRCDSVTQIVFDLGLPSFDTLLQSCYFLSCLCKCKS